MSEVFDLFYSMMMIKTIMTPMIIMVTIIYLSVGLACHVDEHIFIDQVDEVKRIAGERYKRDLPILLVTNDERFADQVRAAEPGYNLLQTFQVKAFISTSLLSILILLIAFFCVCTK